MLSLLYASEIEATSEQNRKNKRTGKTDVPYGTQETRNDRKIPSRAAQNGRRRGIRLMEDSPGSSDDDDNEADLYTKRYLDPDVTLDFEVDRKRSVTTSSTKSELVPSSLRDLDVDQSSKLNKGQKRSHNFNRLDCQKKREKIF